jgi:hypothetical protein
MAVQLSTAVRNARLDAIQAAIGVSAILRMYSGSMPANCAAAATGTKLVEDDLASSWASAASGGSKSLSGTPISSTAVGGGAGTNAGYFRIFDSTGATCHVQGTITATGGGGDMTVDNVSIATGQTVNVTSFTLTDGNA